MAHTQLFNHATNVHINEATFIIQNHSCSRPITPSNVDPSKEHAGQEFQIEGNEHNPTPWLTGLTNGTLRPDRAPSPHPPYRDYVCNREGLKMPIPTRPYSCHGPLPQSSHTFVPPSDLVKNTEMSDSSPSKYTQLHDAIKKLNENLTRYSTELHAKHDPLLANLHDDLYFLMKKTTMEDQPVDFYNLDQAIFFNEAYLDGVQDPSEKERVRLCLAKQKLERHVETRSPVDTDEKVKCEDKAPGGLAGYKNSLDQGQVQATNSCHMAFKTNDEDSDNCKTASVDYAATSDGSTTTDLFSPPADMLLPREDKPTLHSRFARNSSSKVYRSINLSSHFEFSRSWLDFGVNLVRPTFSLSDNALQKAIRAYVQYQTDPTSEGADTQLQEAVHSYSIAFENSNERHGLYLAISINYAAVVDELMERTPDYAGPTTIDILSKPAKVFSKRKEKPELYPTLLTNIGAAYLNRFTKSLDPKLDDLDSAGHSFKLVQSMSGQISDLQYCHSLFGSASVTCKRCEFPNPRSSDFAKLHDTIKQLRGVLQRHPEQLGAECYHLLAIAHDCLYRQTKRTSTDDQPTDFRNLDQAMQYNELCLEISQDLTEICTAHLNLAGQQFERHIKTRPTVETYLQESEANLQKAEVLVNGEGALLGHLTELCGIIRANIQSLRNRVRTPDYGSLRCKPPPPSGSHEPTNVEHIHFAITEEPAKV
ncbi:hypothetical protein CPB83DRAFT_865159 [Crepidotus variabilis]|uniref:Uncharacterized protein n=1 Tax=Crepidotus variabilis TaxID=179855 RepID=A0A9P6E3L4_9AGAR|nr:hypothetical protein CPB83DRAFT_865159 [Crepidotus variabilis]